MTTALSHVRFNLEQHLIDRSWARLWATRRQEAGWTVPEKRRLDFLTSEHADEAMHEIQDRALLSPAGFSRLCDLMADVRLQKRLASAGATLADALSRPVGNDGLTPALYLRRLLDETDARVRAQQLRTLLAHCGDTATDFLRAGFAAEYDYRAWRGRSWTAEQANQAKAFLAQTEELAHGLFAELARPHSETRQPSISGLLYGLRAHRLEQVFRAQQRMKRAARFSSEIRLDRIVGRRMRVEEDSLGLWPGGVLTVAVPSDIRVVESSAWAGPIAEVAALSAVGAGLALTITPAELPVEDRWPNADGPAAALAGLSMQWLPDIPYLQAVYGLSGKDLQQARRATAAALLYLLRLSCHFALASDAGLEQVERASWAEEQARACGEVLGIPVQPRELALLGVMPRVAQSRAIGQLFGLRWHGALRDRLDDDYFRNPRFAEALHCATARGHQWTTAELQAEWTVGEDMQAAARAAEWF